MHLIRNQAYSQGYRGFESLTLRHWVRVVRVAMAVTWRRASARPPGGGRTPAPARNLTGSRAGVVQSIIGS